jgi:hypothetical protein
MSDDMPNFEDVLEFITTYVGNQKSMDRLFDSMARARPELWASLREFDSHWLRKADEMAEAAFIYGFLCARRMTRVSLSQATGTDLEEEDEGRSKPATGKEEQEP